MTRFRALLIGLGLLLGIALNLTVAPQIMSPRPPVFNGADIAANWEWRSMAIQDHSWWLWEQFPEATVTNVGWIPPRGYPDGLKVGMIWEKWTDEYFTTDLDTSEPPLDITELGIRDEVLSHQKVYSRILCRTDQEMVDEDGCYYFVAWSPELLSNDPPTFVGVLTSREKDDEEVGLIEVELLRSLSPIPYEDIMSIEESSQ